MSNIPALGEFNEYRKKQGAEHATSKAENEKITANAKSLEERFYRLTGLSRPAEKDAEGFRIYATGPYHASVGILIIKTEGVEALLAALKNLPEP